MTIREILPQVSPFVQYHIYFSRAQRLKDVKYLTRWKLHIWKHEEGACMTYRATKQGRDCNAGVGW